MQSKFDPIEVGWKGTQYQVPADKNFELLGRLEEILAPPGSFQSVLDVLGNPQRAHLTKLAQAYATALRMAGCPVSDMEVYQSLAQAVTQGAEDGFEMITTLAFGLGVMFFPAWAKDEPLAQDDAPGKAEPAGASSHAG